MSLEEAIKRLTSIVLSTRDVEALRCVVSELERCKLDLATAQDRNMQYLRERRDPRLRRQTQPRWEYATQLKDEDDKWKFQRRGLTRAQAELPPADPDVEWRMVRRLLGLWEPVGDHESGGVA